MTSPSEILPGVLFHSYLSATRKEKVGFLSNHSLVLMVSGHFTLQTADETISLKAGEMLLIGKNQLGQITKTPLPGENYETIRISLEEELLRKIALEEHIPSGKKYSGPRNILIPTNDFLKSYFLSIVPYVRNPEMPVAHEMGLLKVKEAVKLLLLAMPSLRSLLFDFSEPHKIDLEKFMLTHFHYNIPVTEFAELTGRSLAAFKRDFQKIFAMAPRQWLQAKRLTEAKNLIDNQQKKSSEIYLDLGFESLSHFSTAFKKKFGRAPSEIPVSLR